MYSFLRNDHQSQRASPSKLCCYVASVVSNSVRPYGLEPTRLLHSWGSPGKSTGVAGKSVLVLVVSKETEPIQERSTERHTHRERELPDIGSCDHGAWEAPHLQTGYPGRPEVLFKGLRARRPALQVPTCVWRPKNHEQGKSGPSCSNQVKSKLSLPLPSCSLQAPSGSYKAQPR